MLEALDSVANMVLQRNESEFIADETLCYAVAQRLTIVGEAASRVSAEVRDQYSSVPWADIIALRNILVHQYFGIHRPLVWQTATDHAPLLRHKIAEILTLEFPE
jgi:uncharacterized protein with HEPN domain